MIIYLLILSTNLGPSFEFSYDKPAYAFQRLSDCQKELDKTKDVMKLPSYMKLECRPIEMILD